MARRALISGITGQDGSYLAEHLLEQGYEVHGIVRRVATDQEDHRYWRLRAILPLVELHAGSLESYPSIYRIVQQVRPDECYHLAAQSFVSYAFEDEFSTLNTNINGTHFILSSIRDVAPQCRFYFAASSEMFGKAQSSPQNEETPFHPRSTYGISKATGFDLTRNYREAYGLYACSGILFNHESPRRGHEFVTRKITQAVARIKLGLQSELRLGNVEARRDWGYAPDYVRAMALMLQQPEPQDLVIATGVCHSVRDFVELAFGEAGLDWKQYVVRDEKLFRPAEVHLLAGDASRARQTLGWQPSTGFDKLVKMMVRADLDELESQMVPRGNGRTAAGCEETSQPSKGAR